jgi:hypothetical protein
MKCIFDKSIDCHGLDTADMSKFPCDECSTALRQKIAEKRAKKPLLYTRITIILIILLSIVIVLIGIFKH